MNGSVALVDGSAVGLADLLRGSGSAGAAALALLATLIKGCHQDPEPEPLRVPEPLPVVDEVHPAPLLLPEPEEVKEVPQHAEPELPPQHAEPEEVKEVGPRPPMQYSLAKRSREEVWPIAVVPESKCEAQSRSPKRSRGSDGNFDSYERPCATADDIARAFAPTGQFRLEPTIKMAPEECEVRIDELQRRFRISLSKQSIRKEREKRSVAAAAIAEYQSCLRNAQQLEQLFVYVETLRKLASSK